MLITSNSNTTSNFIYLFFILFCSIKIFFLSSQILKYGILHYLLCYRYNLLVTGDDVVTFKHRGRELLNDTHVYSNQRFKTPKLSSTYVHYYK
jgi:hypothetical protein